MTSLVYGEYKNGSDSIIINKPSIVLWSKRFPLPSDNYNYDSSSNTITFGDGRKFRYSANKLIEISTNKQYSYNATGVLIYGRYGTGSYGTPQFIVSETSITVNGQGTTTDLGPYTYSDPTITLSAIPPAPWSSYQTLTFVNDATQDAYLRDSNGRVYLIASTSSIKKAPKLSRSSLRTSEVVSIKNPVINLVTDFAWTTSFAGIYDLGDPHLVYNGSNYYMTTSHSWGPELLNSTKTSPDITIRSDRRPNGATIIRRGDGTFAMRGVPLWKCDDSHNLNFWKFYGNIFESDINGVYWTGDQYYYCKMWAPQIMMNGSGKFVLIVSTARYSDYDTAYNNTNNTNDIGLFYAVANSVEEFSLNHVRPPAYSTGLGFDSYNNTVPNGQTATTLYPFLLSPAAGSSTITGTDYSNFKCKPTPTTFIRNAGPRDYYSMCIDGDLMYDKELNVHYLCFVRDPAGVQTTENIGIVQVDYDASSKKFSVVNSACNVIYPFTSTTEFASVYTTLNSYCTSSCQVTDTMCTAACNYQLGSSEYSNTFGRGASTFSIEAPSLFKRRSSSGQFFYYLFYSGGEYNGKQYSINYIAAPTVNELRSGSTTRWHGRFISQISGSLSGAPTYSFGHGHHADPGPDGHIYYSYHMCDLSHTTSPRQVCISKLEFFQSKSDPSKGDAYIYPVQGNFTLGENKKIKGF